MKKLIGLLLVSAMLAALVGCSGGGERERDLTREEDDIVENSSIKMKISDMDVSVEWEENESVEALRELLKDGPLTVQMSMYGGFEQVGPLGTDLPRDDRQTVTESGDMVLYSGDQIVVFYGSNSWAYTRLGHITDKTDEELTEMLSKGDVAITLSLE